MECMQLVLRCKPYKQEMTRGLPSKTGRVIQRHQSEPAPSGICMPPNPKEKCQWLQYVSRESVAGVSACKRSGTFAGESKNPPIYRSVAGLSTSSAA